jgi:hypothetical protein
MASLAAVKSLLSRREGDVIGDLVLDSPDSGVGDFGLGFAVEEGVDLGGGTRRRRRRG